jgi:hypothetical protein
MAAPSYVFTIARVAKLLGEPEELLHDIAMLLVAGFRFCWSAGP